MHIKPFRELIALSKEKLDEAMAPIRARRFQAQVALEQSKLETEQLEKENRVQELLISKEPNLPSIIDLLDDIAIIERRSQSYTALAAQLFPTPGTTTDTVAGA